MTATGAPLFHLALAGEWAEARASGTYDRSTVGRSLADEGFIHCSFAEQVPATADRYYSGRHDVVLLRIDPALLGDADVVVEEASGTGEAFPHVYGPIPVAAVLSARPVPVDDDGRLLVSDLLDS